MWVRDRWLDKIFDPNLLGSVLDSLCRNFEKLESFCKLKLGQTKLPESKMQYAQIVEVHLGMHLPALLDHDVTDHILCFLLEARPVGGAIGFLLCDVKTLNSSKLISFQVLQLSFGVPQHAHVLLAGVFADF